MENQPFQQKPISARTSGQQRPPQRTTPPRMPQRQPIQTQRPPQQPPRQPQNQNPKKKKKGVGYRRRRNALLILLALMIVIVLICTRCSSCRSISKDDGVQVNAPTEVTTQDASAATEAASDASEASTEEETAKSGTVHVVAAGDHFVQTSVYNSAAAHAENGETYNFAYVYDGVKDLINGSNADLRIINQETLICDNPDIEISGSNFNFNSPPEAGEAIVDLGFNVVSMCNNHLLDKGVEGLTSCMNYWGMVTLQ